MRGMVEQIKKSKKPNLVGVEVGVMKGNHSVEILKELSIKMLYLVDPYLPYIDYDGYIKKKVILDKRYARKKLMYYNNIMFIYMSSKKASNMFKDEYFDFVYIDANHSYKHVYNDICVWYPKVRVGGMIGGHDFNTQHNDVILAVFDFIDKYNLQLCGFDNEDWWMKKTKIIKDKMKCGSCIREIDMVTFNWFGGTDRCPFCNEKLV